MKKISNFAVISAVIMLILAVLFALFYFCNCLTSRFPVLLEGVTRPIMYIDLFTIATFIRRSIFIVFFALLLSQSQLQSSVKSPALAGMIVSCLALLSVLNWRLYILWAWLWMLGFGISSIVIAYRIKDKVFRGVVVAYVAVELLVLAVDRYLIMTHHYDLWRSVFDSCAGKLIVILIVLLEAGYLFTFSRIQSTAGDEMR